MTRKAHLNPSIKYMHFRMEQEGNPIGSRGGATVALIQDGERVLAAVAYCSPKDNFNYAYGRAKAAGRLIRLGSDNSREDNDKYFIFDTTDFKDVRSRLVDFMCSGLGYVYRGPKKES